MPRTADQNQEMREATQAAILHSAMVLFARYGYAHTSIRKIASEAGIATGLMYHYFDSKERLLRAVFDQCMAVLAESFAQAMDHPEPAQRLTRLLHAIFDTLAADVDFWALFYMMRTQPAVMALLGDDFRLWTRRLRDLISADLAALGRADAEIEAYLLYSLIEGTIQQYLLEPERYPLAAVVERIVGEYRV